MFRIRGEGCEVNLNERSNLELFILSSNRPLSIREEIEHLLWKAAKKSNTDEENYEGKRIVEFVIHSGYRDKPEVDEDGKPLLRRTTPLHRAARDECGVLSERKLSESIPSLFKIYKRFDVNYTDEFGLTHFHVACAHGCYDIVKKFLELGQDPDCLPQESAEKFLHSPLHLALYYNHKRVAELLLNSGASPNLTDAKGSTSLHIICRHCSYDFLEMVFKISDDKHQAVQVNAQDKLGNTPLQLALLNESKEMVELLLRRGADPHVANAAGSTALHLICSKGLVDLAKILFELSHENNQPVQVNAQDKLGNTPLLLVLDHAYENLTLKDKYLGNPLRSEYEHYRHTICFAKAMCRMSGLTTAHTIESRRRKDLVLFLLRQGADLNLPNAEGLTPVHCICKDYFNDDRDLAQLLFEIHNEFNQPLWVDAQDNLGNTPLHLALKYDNLQVAKLLLIKGAGPNLPNADGLTPLHHICQRSRRIDDMVDVFFRVNDELNQQVHIDAPDKWGNRPLHLALRQNKKKAVKSLMSRGANPNLTNAEGLTPLHLIYTMGNEYGLTKTLLEIYDGLNQPLNIEARDKLGRTPLQWAVAGLQPDVVDVLLDRGADLSSFVFPTQSHFDECLKSFTSEEENLILILQLGFGALAVFQQLDKRNYELDRSDVLTIMTLLYGTYGLFEKSKLERPTDAEIYWYDDEKFTRKARKIKINSSYSLYDLTRIEPQEAKKINLYSDFFKFMHSKYLYKFSKQQREACTLHLFEKLSRGFFQKWALDPFWGLIHYRLPIEICEIILEKLKNRDLCNICFAVKLHKS